MPQPHQLPRSFMILCLVAAQLLAFSPAVMAKGWGTFVGPFGNGQVLFLVPMENTPSKSYPEVEDIRSIVEVKQARSALRSWAEVCHRFDGSMTDLIWCDGNKESPLHGTTYIRTLQTIDVPSELRKFNNGRKSAKVIHKCATGCGYGAPQYLLYIDD
jgi:hypothetical protein